MKKLTLILTLIGLSINLFSQELNEEIITGFYYQTFNDYFSNKSHLKENTDFYIQADSAQIKTQTEFNDFKIHFVSKYQAQTLIKKNKISELYWTKIKEINNDTIDVLIGGWTVDYKSKFLKKGTFTYASLCGGTNAYVPQGRFIYNYETKKWDFMTEMEIINNKITEYQNKLKE